jgi:hypothetical protein
MFMAVSQSLTGTNELAPLRFFWYACANAATGPTAGEILMTLMSAQADVAKQPMAIKDKIFLNIDFPCYKDMKW